jgi:glycosyltransferase involved in cell wall biosynthesis
VPRIAVIHDWFSVYAGAERVVEQILRLYPEADLFSLVDFLPPGERAFLQGKPVRTSFIQNLPFARKSFRNYLALMPLAVEQFDLAEYNLVISSSHAVAKGVLTGPDQLHLSYIHTPIRYAWEMQPAYLREARLERGIKSWMARLVLHSLRTWDLRTMNSIDAIATNSKFIARRIWKTYRREAEVIFPPVDLERFQLFEPKEDFYLTASRLVPLKRVGLIVEAFRQLPERKLVVVGDGPELLAIRAAAPPNVEVLGYQSTPVLVRLMQQARAFLIAAQEDFGIAPVEAQACGTPVIAYGRGGALETVCGLDEPRPTGVFFLSQSPESIVQAVRQFEENEKRITPQACRTNAERFRTERFQREFSAFVETHWRRFYQNRENAGNS